MHKLTPPDSIYISTSSIDGGGRGVFARTKIVAGACIEQCPVITLEPKSRKNLRKTGLVNYYFLWNAGDTTNVSLCFGYGSIYNHSFAPNARYVHNPKEARIEFYALRNIEADEEIFVNYNGDPEDMRPLRLPGMPGVSDFRLPFHKRIASAVTRRVRYALKLINFF